jgi:hypothetical protein
MQSTSSESPPDSTIIRTGSDGRLRYSPEHMFECAKRHGHNPEAWLTDVPERLPAMANQDDLSVLLPSNWQPAPVAATAPATQTHVACPV